MAGEDTSLWNTYPSGTGNGAGPAVANLLGGSALASVDPTTSGIPSFSSNGGGAVTTPGAIVGAQPTDFCKFFRSIPLIGVGMTNLMCPGYQDAATQGAQATYESGNLSAPNQPTTTPPPGSPGADVTKAISDTVGSIFANKSLWLLAGMILLFVLVVMIIRR